MVMSPLVGYVSRRTGDVKVLIFIGYALFLASVIGMCTSEPGSKNAVLGYLAIGGIAWAFPLVLLVTVAQLNVPGELIGTVTAAMLTSRGLGGAIGSAIMSAVLTAKENAKIPAYIIDAVLPLGFNPEYLPDLIPLLTGGQVALAEQVPTATPAIVFAGLGAVAKAFSDSFRYVWYMIIPFVVIAMILIPFIVNIRPEMTGVVDASVNVVEKEVDSTSHLEA